jgi:hypothetical protein
VGEVYGAQRRPRKRRGKRRGRRLLITLLVLLIILAAGLAVLDRFAVSYAERRISDEVTTQVADQQATSEKPEVTIEGVPFLTQVADGRYQAIKIQLADFAGPAGNGKTVRIPLLDVRATDVVAPLDTIRSGRGEIKAASVTGSGTIDYAQLTTLIGQPGLKITEKGGKLAGSAPVQALGQTFNASFTATLTVRNGVLQVRFTDVTAAELPNVPLVRSAINAYARRLGLDLKVPTLPLKLALQKVEPRADGLHITAGANDVSLNSAGL